jgi:transposase
MLDDTSTLPDNPSVLKDLVASLASELKSRDLVIEKLKHQLAGLRRHQFGIRSESLVRPSPIVGQFRD